MDLPEIILRKFESKELDYKAPCAWNEADKKSCCQLVKDILALANTHGGWLVIGVSEVPTGFSLEGVSADQAKSFDTSRLNRFVQNYADPPINALVHKVEVQGKYYVVIQVPAFAATPHVGCKDFPGVLASCAVYVRTDNNESAPLSRSADFQLLVERAVKNRADQLLTAFRAVLKHGMQPQEPPDRDKFQEQIEQAEKRCHELNPHRSKPYGYRVSSFYPAKFTQERYSLSVLKTMANNASIDFRGWPFLFFSHGNPDLTTAMANGYETFIPEPNPFIGGDALHFWQLRQSGLLYVRQMLHEDTAASVGKAARMLDFDGLAAASGEAVHCLTKLYDGQLDDSEEVVMRFTVTGVMDRPLSSRYPGRDIWPGRVCRMTQITHEQQHPLAEWKAGLMDHALAICNHILIRFNWDAPNLSACRQVIERVFARNF